MIEINLLPAELRQSEGTPLPRLASILGGALAATLGVVLVANYYVVDIPRTRQNIKTMEERKKKVEAEKVEVDKIRAEIDKIKLKVAALKNLERSRVRWARVLNAFSKAIPDGAVVRSFRVDPEAAGGEGDVGKKMKLTIAGMTTGEAYVDCTRKLTETWNNLKREFEVPEAKSPTGDAVPAVAPANPPAEGGLDMPPGYSKKLGLKFQEPVIVNFAPIIPPKMTFKTDEESKKFRQPPSGLDFTITVSFYLLPPVQGQ